MHETSETLLPILRHLAGPGAGIVAFYTFDALRSRFPQPATAPASLVARLFYTAIYARRYARISAMVLAALIAIIASMLVAALSGGDVAMALDASLAVAFSQLAHTFGLSGQVPAQIVPAVATPAPQREPRPFGFDLWVKRSKVRIYGPEDAQ